MSNIDKQAVQAVSDLKAGYTLGHADVEILNELARIALASLEAEAVAYIIQDADARGRGEKGILRYFANISDEDINEYEITVTPLYTDPPAPVSVPDKIDKWQAIDDIRDHDESFRWDSADGYAAGWNACRAAMLQGAEPVTTAYKLRDSVETIRNSGIAVDAEKIQAEHDALNTPDCWCRTCRPVKLNDMRFVVCPECGNKRCPHANNHRSACTGSNEPGQEGSAYPAAPQQEVK